MEENSEAHMETDVSSTTDDVPETQEVTGSHGDVEMVVVVEEIKEEQDNSVDTKDEQPQSSRTSNTRGETTPQKKSTPQKESTPQKIVIKSPVKENNVSKVLLMSPITYEPQKTLKQNSPVSVTDITSPQKKQEPVSSESSAKAEATPGKTMEKHVARSPVKVSENQVIHKSPFKGIKLVSKSPIKLKRLQVNHPNNEVNIQEKTLLKIVQEIPDKEVNLQKTSNKEVKLQETSSNRIHKLHENMNNQVTMQEKSPNKEVNLQEISSKKPKLQENTLTKEKIVEPNPKAEVKLVENCSTDSENKPTTESDLQNKLSMELDSETENKVLDSTTITTLDVQIVSAPDSSNALSQVPSETTTTTQDVSTSESSKAISQVPSQTTIPTNDAQDVSTSDGSNTLTGKTDNEVIKTVNGGDKNDVRILPADTVPNNDSLNDSQISSDVSEKEHNKSISRELKSLINSAKESKIISECTQLTSKTRKSRSQVDASNISLNSSFEVDKVERTRRGSTNSQVSNSSEKSDRSAVKRSMRSQNPEFVNKCKQFLHSVTGKVIKDSDEPMSDDETNTNFKEKPVSENADSSITTPKKNKKVPDSILDGNEKANKLRSDAYCWRCHWIVEQDGNDKTHPPLRCTVCPRSYHFKCLSTNERKTVPEKNWVCPDCLQVLLAEGSDTRSQAMKKTSLGMLCDLLKYALERMMDLNGVEPFMHPVDRTTFPDYDKYVAHPMDLSQMKQNITDGLYGSTEAFVADAQWILHNSIIFNTCEQAFLQSKLTGGARALVRSCRAEMGEIEACPECYASAHARKPTWFTDVCTTPHILLWAKLKGFPYWPAKGMTVNSSGLVDVRFFGAHDRAWVPAKDCFLFSEKDPNNFRNKRQDILDSMQEAEQHIRNISRKYGKFVYPPFKTQLDPSKLTEQLKMMIPSFEGEIKMPTKDKAASASPFTTKEKRRSNSKSSKSSVNDGDGSESEDTSTSSRTEAIKHDRHNSSGKSTKVDSHVVVSVPTTPVVETIATRKRRRSNLEEAVMTVIDTSSTAKKRRIDSTEHKKRIDSAEHKKRTDSAEQKKRIDTAEQKKQTDSAEQKTQIDSIEQKKRIDSTEQKKLIDSTEQKKRIDSTEQKKRIEITEQKKKIDITEQKKSEKQEPSSSKEEKAQLITKIEDAESTSKKKTDTPKAKTRVEEPSSSTMLEKESLRVTPIKLVALPRPNKQTPKMFAATKVPSKPSTPKEEDKTPQRAKPTRSEKPSTGEKAKEDKAKAQKRRNSKTNKSLNTSSPKVGKTAEKKTESNEATSSKELRPREVKKKDAKDSDGEVIKSTAPNSLLRTIVITKPSKESKFDDDTTLAVLARERRHPNSGLPTISNVCSLSTAAQSAGTTDTPTTSTAQSIEITVEASSNSSIFTPTSTDNVRNMREAVSKLQKLRETTEPVVGRVGVRSFARMTSPGRADDVEIEIKAEPVDLEEPDEDRLNEKMDLMNACKLQPVNAPCTLREVRIARVMPGAGARRGAARARARKSFPAPRREEPRSDLNGKNSMVYIPIQPPASQPPRTRPAQAQIRPIASQTSGNNAVNTVITPLKPNTSTLSSPSSSTANACVPTAGQVVVPTVGQVPTTVHTVPLMTSVNGQWMFSLQPVMSVGGVDNSTSGMVNGVADRVNAPTVMSLSAAPQNSASAPATTAQITRNDANTPKELPRLQQRPALQNPLDPGTAPAAPLPPAAAGPLTAKLNQNAGKLADFFRTLLEDSIDKLEEPNASAAALRLQLEQARWRHLQEVEELKHNQDLTLAEMRLSFEKDKIRATSEVRRAALMELEAAVKVAKSKQWCANCSQEAQFYCCWNTAYCDYPCQRAHWPTHYSSCAQRPRDDNEDETSAPETRLQPQPENLPALQKSTPAQTPALTVGGKVATPRLFTSPDTAAPKTSIIVSMVEDNSGNQTMKCVGTYKPVQGQGPNQISPVIINKQVINEEGGKKVVTSGGYLIVGAGNTSSVITPAPSRRPHTIQYFS